MASYNPNSRKWIRINGKLKAESSGRIKDEMMAMYPMMKQAYIDKDEMYLAIFKLFPEDIAIY